MELLFNLTDDQRFDVYEDVCKDFCYDDITTQHWENEYRKAENMTDDEIKEAVEHMSEILVNYCDYSSAARCAIDYVLDKRPQDAIQMVLDERPEEFRPPNMLDKALAAYGLEVGQKFRWRGCVYWVDEIGDLYYDENLISSCYTFGTLLAEASVEDIEILPSCTEALKPQPPDLLNDTLKSIGLKTMQYFKIADKEFETDDFYIDSFGDVYWVNGHPDDPDRETACDEQHEFLTLGRILTQYYDKVVPFEE